MLYELAPVTAAQFSVAPVDVTPELVRVVGVPQVIVPPVVVKVDCVEYAELPVAQVALT